VRRFRANDFFFNMIQGQASLAVSGRLVAVLEDI